MQYLANKEFWEAAAFRAIRTIAQTAVTLIGTGAVGFTDLDWVHILSVSGVAGVLSVLTCIATGLPEAEESEGNTTAKG
jgi:hypothetical protein